MANEVRPIEITEEQLLAIKAMAYGCANNKRLVGASYMTGLSTDNPQSIPFGKAWVIVQEFVEELPTIDPESLRPKGRWIKDRDGDEYCENCSRYMPAREITGDPSAHNYCPNCGAKMEG